MASLSISGDTTVTVQGVLDFETVPVLAKEAERLFRKMDKVHVSFADVEDSNSTGLALLLEMARIMKLDNKSISFSELPEQMFIVARAYGMNSELDTYLKT
jgi:phospholipid transport system transporter-binding protein